MPHAPDDDTSAGPDDAPFGPDEHAHEEGYDDDGYGSPERRRWRGPATLAAVVALIGLGVGLGLGLSGGSSNPPAGPEGVPLQHVPDLASPNTTLSGKPVDGITCRPTMEQSVTYHIHVHLAIFIDGRQERIPAGAGIARPRVDEELPGGLFVDNSDTSCLYWLHVHADDGIIHVETPARRDFVLGQFFDIWGQPLSPDQLGPAKGPVTAFENGRRFTGNPRDIPLLPQAVIQLDVGHPVIAFEPLRFKVTGLCSTTCTVPPSKS